MNLITSTPSNRTENKEDDLVKQGEEVVAKKLSVDNDALIDLTGKLIDLYDNPFLREQLRNKSARIVAMLAGLHESILGLVIENAKKYARSQHIDDASPYSPNSFEVLSEIKKSDQKMIISFLKETIQSNYGIPRWEAIKALCRIHHSDAKNFINEVIKKKYPSKYYDISYDLAIIEFVKGQDYINEASKQK